MKRILILALVGAPTVAAANEPIMGTWVSYPRAAITIVVDKKGGRIMGPGWERAFTPIRDRPVRIQLDERSRFVLRLRRDGAWAGTYYHPSVRPGEKGQFRRHLMLLPGK
jgi:hypothetical protein